MVLEFRWYWQCKNKMLANTTALLPLLLLPFLVPSGNLIQSSTHTGYEKNRWKQNEWKKTESCSEKKRARWIGIQEGGWKNKEKISGERDMEGNDRGLWITWQLGKSERGRDNQEKEAMRVYLQQQVFRLEGRRPQEGQGAGRIHPHSPGGHSSSSLFVLFSFFFYIHTDGFCILYSLPWTVAFHGWCARFVCWICQAP